jgi:hypothetical protein
MFFQRTVISFMFCNISLHIFALEWSGINALLYYGPTLVRKDGDDK